MDVSTIGRTLLLIGVLIAAFGALLLFAGRIPFFGQLPGDITVERGPVTFFFPLATGILLSIILTVVLNVALRFFNR